MKTFKDYLSEAVEHGAPKLTAKLTAVADALFAKGTRDATHLANKFYDFIQTHAQKSYPEGELKSLKDDAVHYAKKWDHIVNKRATDAIGSAILALKNGDVEPEKPNDLFIDDLSVDDFGESEEDLMTDIPIEEEAEYDHGTYDYYDPTTKMFRTGEFADQGKGNLKQQKNNPRFGDNSLKDETLNEDEDDKEHYSSFKEWKVAARSAFPNVTIVEYKDRFYRAINDAGKDDSEYVGEWDYELNDGWVKKSGLSEDIHMPEQLHLDRLQELLNDAGVSDDEIISGIGGIQPDAKARVAQALNVPVDHIDFMINELSTKLSKEDEKNYGMFTEDFFAEEFHRIMEEDERFGYQQDSMGNVEITDTLTGKSVYLQGTEAQEVLQKLTIAPQHAQMILSDFEHVMESKKPKDWKAGGKNDIKMAVSKNIKEESKLKTAPEKPELEKAPFKHTRKIVKKVKPVTESLLDEDDFMHEIHSDSGSYNFPWKADGHTGTGTATFTIKQGEPLIKVISVRNTQGDEINDYDPSDMLEQAKRFIPDA